MSDTRNAPSLDGREFLMESSTASEVDPNSPSRFRYSERDGIVWGDYDGDTVTFGRMLGTRTGDVMTITFAHVMVSDGRVVTGSSLDRIETDGLGGIRLVEEFRIGDVDHFSICVEA